MTAEKQPVTVTVQRSRAEQARILWEQRAARIAERKLPDIQEAMVAKVNRFFEGVDLSTPGVSENGAIDISIRDEDDERKATASANGLKLASISIWKNPNSENFDATDKRSRIYTLSGSANGVRVELGYITPSVDYYTGEEFEGSFHGRVFLGNDTPVNRAYGRVINDPLQIQVIAAALGITA